MRSIGVLVSLSLLTVTGVPRGFSASVELPIAELTDGPIEFSFDAPAQFAVNHGSVFEDVESVTLSIIGDLASHTWKSCDVNSGCESTPYTFDGWAVNLYKPGLAGNLVQYFTGGESINRHVELFDLGGNTIWDSVKSGDLSFVIYPVAEGGYIGTHYWDLISRPTIELSEATLTFRGELVAAGSPPDFNGDGVVDAADYVTWRMGFGTQYSMADYDDWKESLGGVVGSGSNSHFAMPEPGTLIPVYVGALLYGARKFFSRTGKSCRSRF